MKPIEQMTFDELVRHAGQQVLLSFWDNGKEGFKNALYLWMGQAIVWKEAQNKKVKKR